MKRIISSNIEKDRNDHQQNRDEKMSEREKKRVGGGCDRNDRNERVIDRQRQSRERGKERAREKDR